MLIDSLLIIFLVFLNAFFVAAEFALVKVRSSQLEVLSSNGDSRATLSLSILKNLDAYLSATQLGITIASLLLGAIGEHVVMEGLLHVFEKMQLNISTEWIQNLSFFISITLITIMHIVFGEQAPKTLAIEQAEKVTLLVSIPMRIFYFVFKPFILILNWMTYIVLKLFGLKSHSESVHSAQELELLIDQGKKSGALQESEHQLIKNVFGFMDVAVRQVMTPRTSINAIDVTLPIDYILNKVTQEGYSRLPVYKDDIDNIIGVLYSKDLLKLVHKKSIEDIDLQKVIRPAYYVPETKKINQLLQNLQAKHLHMAIVTDEFGGVSGICTIEDIIEELVGEIQDEHDDESPIVEKISDNEFMVNAQASIMDIAEIIEHPFAEGDYDTMAGFIIHHLGRIPDVTEKFEIQGVKFTIIKKSKQSILTVKIVLDK